MSLIWWQLTGPGRFVSDLVADIRDGRNVILQLPKFAPEGLERAVRAEVQDVLRWQEFHVPDSCNIAPAQAVFDRMVPDKFRRGISRNTQSLATHPAFGGRVIYVKNVAPVSWPAWKSFLMEYEHVCRNIRVLDRSVFVFRLEGQWSHDVPEPEVCLSIRKWNNCVDPLDILIYTSTLFSNTDLPPLRKKLAISLCSNLAVFDPEVSRVLSQEPLESIIAPQVVLRRMAQTRGWESSNSDDPSVMWAEGMSYGVGGEDLPHSAVLCLKDPKEELKKRIWSAETSIMVPFVEEQRREILERYGRFFKLPHVTSDGEILTKPNQLEIGHIYNQIMTGIRLDKRTVEKIKRLRRIRNCLVHLELMGADMLDIL
jgi:hypothetical protein